MPYPENRVTLDGLFIPVCQSDLIWKTDLDNNQFQPNQSHDIANDTVAQTGAGNRANHDNGDIVHIMNNREWTEEQKRKLVEIGRQEKRRGKTS